MTTIEALDIRAMDVRTGQERGLRACALYDDVYRRVAVAVPALTVGSEGTGWAEADLR